MDERYIQGKEKVVRIVGSVEKKKKTKETGVFIDGKGYVDENEQVWIYSYSGKPSDANRYPYFWINSDGKKEFSHPDKDVLDLWKNENAIQMDLSTISVKTREDEQLYNEQQINDMNASASKYVPVILESDDFLKKIVKQVILQKNINISRLKYKMNTKYSLPNMIAALNASTKMSVTYFMTWAELLGFDFEIVCKDNKTDTVDPLPDVLLYDSYHDQIRTEKGEIL